MNNLQCVSGVNNYKFAIVSTGVPNDVNILSRASEKCHISDCEDYDNSGMSVIISDPHLSKASSILETSHGFKTFNKLGQENSGIVYSNWPWPFASQYILKNNSELAFFNVSEKLWVKE
jgi:hypothetical protein